MISEEELAEAAAQLAGDETPEPETDAVCPDCGAEFGSRIALGMHRRREHGVEGQAAAARRKAAGKGRERISRPTSTKQISLKGVEDKFVSNVAFVGNLVTIFAAHTGITMVSRAPRTGAVIMGYAAKDERILKAVMRFNAVFEGGEAAELLLQHGAAVAVDLHVVDPHLQLQLPFMPVPMEPVAMLIGDVVEQVDQIKAEAEAAYAAQAPAPNGEVVEGGVTAT